jgi:ppGpp synthetase/RelA/SpoT-type nucleotidyltranferase
MSEDGLWRDAVQARSGARDIVARLQTLMNLGVPSISELAYTIRYRVKDHRKIMDKVSRKQEEKDPDYAVANIRDIVGVRIVTLFRVDAFDVIPRLVDLIRTNAGEGTALFLSTDLEEVKIYSTNPKGDAQALPERLAELFMSLGYSNVEIEGTPSNYSSCHIVTWCRGRHDEGYANVPVEIQVRTALEDAWAEIDHKLKYKPGAHGLTVRDEIELQANKAHLGVMKAFVDGAAQYADQIRARADQVTSTSLGSSSTLRSMQETRAVVQEMTLPVELRNQIAHALDLEREAMHDVRQKREYAQLRVLTLRNALREFEAAIRNVRDTLDLSKSDVRMLERFHLPLEVAFCHFQLGVELDGDKKMLADAVKLYKSIEEEYPDRAIVCYRYGRTLQRLGDLRSAIEKLRRAQKLLADGQDKSIHPRHWLRLAVLRNLGVCLWERADRLRKETRPVGAARNQILDLYLEAYTVTREAYRMGVEPDTFSDKFDTATRYKGRIANNLIYYVGDYLSLEGPIEGLKQRGYQDGDVESYMALLEKHLHLIETPNTLDTMIRHYKSVGDVAKQKKAASRLQRVLRERGIVDATAKAHQAELLAAVAEALGLSRPGEGATPPTARGLVKQPVRKRGSLRPSKRVKMSGSRRSKPKV